ncbi:MAG: cytochrome c3 family protein, partial [Terriglobales bacterium]
MVLTVLAAAGVFWVWVQFERSPYITYAGVRKSQPVPFSHKHHVTGLGIDCRYCHTSVEQSSFAGIPPTKTCMNCHAQIWTNAAYLEPVRESFRAGRSLQWTRVNQLPDYVYFNHSIHVNKGVGCNTCHGPVDQMPLMYQYASLQMEFCLECHRAPEKYLRPREQV